jgi:hypothetical protein
MLGQRLACRLAPPVLSNVEGLELLHRHLLLCRLCGGLSLRRVFLQLEQLQLELVQQRAALGRLAEPFVPQLGDGVLQLLDQQRPLLRTRLRCPARRPFSQQHLLQRLDVVGQGIVGHHITIVEQTKLKATDTLSPSRHVASARRLRSPRPLRQPSVDPFQQIAELCRRDRNRLTLGPRPQEAAPLKVLGQQAPPLAIVP